MSKIDLASTLVNSAADDDLDLSISMMWVLDALALTIEVSVGLKPSKLIATEIFVDHPYIALWSSNRL